ncbi:MAG TPA: hypothetical protein VK747_01950 [Blastocatellia bacterium]|nr:hypothetical protein [Blastocatellia bacterium]
MAQNNDRVDEFYRAAISAGARGNISPRAGVEYYPGYFGRNLDGNRPHLGPGLEWSPAERRSRLAIFAKLLIVKIDSTWRIPGIATSTREPLKQLPGLSSMNYSGNNRLGYTIRIKRHELER